MINTWPKFAKGLPFKKIKVPNELLIDIQAEYDKAKFNDSSADTCFNAQLGRVMNVGGIYFDNYEKPFYLRSLLSNKTFTSWDKTLQPCMEEWSGKELEFITGYGIRSYVKNSMLIAHRDVVDTHIISAIIHVDEYPDVKWPLDFVDHEGNHHQVTFDRGEMLMYESLCVHARETPFPGEYYRNLYLHWRPIDWDPTPYKKNRTDYASIKAGQDEQKAGPQMPTYFT